MKIEDFIEILEAIETGKEIWLPYSLHKGLTKIVSVFGGAERAKLYFLLVKDASKAKIEGETIKNVWKR